MHWEGAGGLPKGEESASGGGGSASRGRGSASGGGGSALGGGGSPSGGWADPPPIHGILWDRVNERAAFILLECILVIFRFCI